jgi:hypothetical protein
MENKMKKIITLLMVVSTSTFASVVTIQPGTSITLSTDTTTTVSCQGSNGSQSRAICYCEYDVMSSGKWIGRMNINGADKWLSSFYDNDSCLSFLNKNPSCK